LVFTESFDAKVMCRFLARLVGHFDRKVHLIVDRHSAHRSKTVRAWLAGHKDQIELHFLPSYSPELNPDELVNADLKRSLHTDIDSVRHSGPPRRVRRPGPGPTGLRTGQRQHAPSTTLPPWPPPGLPPLLHGQHQIVSCVEGLLPAQARRGEEPQTSCARPLTPPGQRPLGNDP
jgi:hypothetical protein